MLFKQKKVISQKVNIIVYDVFIIVTSETMLKKNK